MDLLVLLAVAFALAILGYLLAWVRALLAALALALWGALLLAWTVFAAVLLAQLFPRPALFYAAPLALGAFALMWWGFATVAWHGLRRWRGGDRPGAQPAE